MPQLTPIEKLITVADKHKLSAEDQLWLVRGVSDCRDVVSFDALVDAIDTELSACPAPEPPAPEVTATTRVAEMETLLDRDLAKRSLNKLAPVLPVGSLYAKPGYDTVSLVVDKDGYTTYDGYLNGNIDHTAYAPGDIIGGWYTTFADGSIAAIAITYADAENGGPYVDAFLILPESAAKTAPNISLPVTRTLREDFVFKSPDPQLLTKVVRLTYIDHTQ